MGGMATFVETVVSSRYLRERFDVRLLNTARIQRSDRVTPGRFGARNLRRTLRDARRVFAHARRIDVVHVTTALLPTTTLLRAAALVSAARLRGKAVALHVHTGLANDQPDRSFRPTVVQRYVLRHLSPSVIVAISRSGVRGLAPHVHAPIVLIDNAVDVGSYRRGVRASATGPVKVLYVGTISVRKGLLDLLQAAVALRHSGTGRWMLTIAGPPGALREDGAASVIRSYREAGLGAALVGPKTPDEIRSLMETSDIFVLPSHSEGQPIAVLEAMAAGLPIVATTVGAIPEMVDGVGILLDAGDVEALIAALQELIEGGERRRDLGVAARRRAVERYDTARLERSLASLWYRLSGQRPDRATLVASDDRKRSARHRGGGASRPRIDARDGRITRG